MASKWSENHTKVCFLLHGSWWISVQHEMLMEQSIGWTWEGQIKMVYWYSSFFLFTWFIHISYRPFIRWCHRWWKCLRTNPHQRRGRIRYSDKWTWTMMVRCGPITDRLNSFWIEITKWPCVIIKQQKYVIFKLMYRMHALRACVGFMMWHFQLSQGGA